MINLPFWEAGQTLLAVASVLEQMWLRIQAAVEALSTANDAETCPIKLLDILAYERGIDRLAGEDDALYRLRIKHAFENALDGGSVAGFAKIWERLELGTVIQAERPDAENWDVILVSLDEGKFARYRGLFEQLVRLYGRTCRRYQLVQGYEPGSIGIRAFDVPAEIINVKAVY